MSSLLSPDVGLCLQVDRAKLVRWDGEDAEFLLCRGGKNRRPVVPGRLPGLLHGLHRLPLHGDALREGGGAALKHPPWPETIGGNERICWDNVRCPSFKASKLCTYLLICMKNHFGELIAVKIDGNKFIGSCRRCLCCFIFSLWKAFQSSTWIFLKHVCYG